ncbi:hypothetical protein BDM02DRAFT_3192860 [Thelephora ganbajun]|uniref:Uncharacterized protein n=1 Tax=Thelephora ganbajun TaxID=370292 RepID=A0ACB6YYY9_THEGA|nr:hypothetical protein BDM02DRAFT_3192860 [Thelephora ganbajun]
MGKPRTNSPSIFPDLIPVIWHNFPRQSGPVFFLTPHLEHSRLFMAIARSPPIVTSAPTTTKEAMSAIENLPNEILTAIFSFLPTASLQQSLLISHRFRALTELLLYTSVSIQEAVQLANSQDGGPYKTWRWCRTILERPHLVQCVKSLTIRWFADHNTRHTNHHPFHTRPAHPTTATLTGDIDLEHVFVELATILPNLTLLESLELHLPTLTSRHPDSATHLALGNRLLRPTSFPNLSCLAISGLVPPPQFFLPSSCPSLTTLRFSDIHELPYPLPYDALPNLSSFKGSPATAAAILPGRPVRSLSLVGFEYLRAAEWEGISRVQSIVNPAYRGIETLDLSGMSVTPNLLRDVARWVPTVKDLKIRLTLRHTLHHALGGIALLTALSPVLLSLTNLTTLDMSPTTGASTAQVQEELMLCQTWSKYCGLRKVVFPSGDVWTQPLKEPELSSESSGWILAGGSNIASPSSSSANNSRRSSSEFVSTDNGAGGHNNPLEGLTPQYAPPPLPHSP